MILHHRRTLLAALLILVSGCNASSHQQQETNTLECLGYCKLELDQKSTKVLGSGSVEVEGEVDSDSSVD